MNEIILAAIVGFLLGVLWQRHGWRVEALLAANWPTRCAKCKQWQPHYKTRRVERTTRHWINLCVPCFNAEYHPWTSQT